MFDLFILLWIFLFWGDVAFTKYNFELNRKLEPNLDFKDFELNSTAVFLTEKYGFAVASLILFFIGLIAMLFLYMTNMHLVIISFILGLYVMIYGIHLFVFLRTRKRINLNS